MVDEDSRSLLGAADQAMRAGDTRAAAVLLERVVALGQATADDLLRVAVTRRALGDVAGALDAVTATLRLRPEHFLALLMGGSLLVRLGRREDAANAYRAALRIAPPVSQLPPTLRRELDTGRAFVADEEAWRASLGQRPIAGLDQATPEQRARIEAFRAALGTGNAAGFTYPGLPQLGFVDPAGIEGVAALEAGTEAIRDELLALAATRAPALHSFLQHAGADLPADGDAGRWSVMQLIADGNPVAANADVCPETMRLCGGLGMPAIPGRSPNLMFSILDPHARIPAHRGVTNTRLVLHLPLIVPDECGIRVGEETRRWQPGRAMAFDDTEEHEAWNDSDEVRVVLLGDLWRPELAPVEREAVVALAGR